MNDDLRLLFVEGQNHLADLIEVLRRRADQQRVCCVLRLEEHLLLDLFCVAGKIRIAQGLSLSVKKVLDDRRDGGRCNVFQFDQCRAMIGQVARIQAVHQRLDDFEGFLGSERDDTVRSRVDGEPHRDDAACLFGSGKLHAHAGVGRRLVAEQLVEQIGCLLSIRIFQFEMAER